MRAFFIDPAMRVVRECEIELSNKVLEQLLGGLSDRHWIVEQTFPGHEGYVDVHGLNNKRKLWFFRNVHVWGPLLVTDKQENLSVEAVRKVCRFG